MNFIDSFPATADALVRRAADGGSLLIDVKHLRLSAIGNNLLIQALGQPGMTLELPISKVRLVFRDTNEIPRVPRTALQQHKSK